LSGCSLAIPSSGPFGFARVQILVHG
jgi:hypothetical protein